MAVGGMSGPGQPRFLPDSRDGPDRGTRPSAYFDADEMTFAGLPVSGSPVDPCWNRVRSSKHPCLCDQGVHLQISGMHELCQPSRLIGYL